MPPGSGRPDQAATGWFFHHLLRITFGCGRDGLERLCASPSQNCVSTVGYPSSTTGLPLTAERRLSAKAICLIPSAETFPSYDSNLRSRSVIE